MYNKKVLSEATKNLNSTKAPAKKKDRIVNNNKLLPFISNEGYKQGPPPAGTHYRIPSNTIYNPTDQNIIAVGSDGEKRFVAAGDTRNHRFGGSEYVDEFPMAAYGGDISIPDLNQYEDGGEYDLTEDEINELKAGGYIVEDISVPQLTKAQYGITTVPTQEETQFAQRSTKAIPYADKEITLPEVTVTPAGYKGPTNLNNPNALLSSQQRTLAQGKGPLQTGKVNSYNKPVSDKEWKRKQAKDKLIRSGVAAEMYPGYFDQDLMNVQDPLELGEVMDYDTNINQNAEDARYRIWKKNEERAYQNAGYGDRLLNELQSFASDPLSQVYRAVTGKRSLMGQGYRDIAGEDYDDTRFYDRVDDRNKSELGSLGASALNLGSEILNIFNPMQYGALAGNSFRKGNYLEGASNVAEGLLAGSSLTKSNTLKKLFNAKMAAETVQSAPETINTLLDPNIDLGDKALLTAMDLWFLRSGMRDLKPGLKSVAQDIKALAPAKQTIPGSPSYLRDLKYSLLNQGKLPTYKTVTRWQPDKVPQDLVQAGQRTLTPEQQALTGSWYGYAPKGLEKDAAAAQGFYLQTRPGAGNIHSLRMSDRQIKELENAMPASAKGMSGKTNSQVASNEWMKGELVMPEQIRKTAKTTRFDVNPSEYIATQMPANANYAPNSPLHKWTQRYEIGQHANDVVNSQYGPIFGIPRQYFPFKKGGERKFSRSLEAKNRLFAENPLLKKKKSKKRKIFNPNAKYYQDGGFQDDINKRRSVLEDWTYGQSIGMLQEKQLGGQQYRYQGREDAVYTKDIKGNWLIKSPGTKMQWQRIDDPTGKRTTLLNKQAIPLDNIEKVSMNEGMMNKVHADRYANKIKNLRNELKVYNNELKYEPQFDVPVSESTRVDTGLLPASVQKEKQNAALQKRTKAERMKSIEAYLKFEQEKQKQAAYDRSPEGVREAALQAKLDWYNRSSGRAQPADWFWTLPLAAAKAPQIATALVEANALTDIPLTIANVARPGLTVGNAMRAYTVGSSVAGLPQAFTDLNSAKTSDQKITATRDLVHRIIGSTPIVKWENSIYNTFSTPLTFADNTRKYFSGEELNPLTTGSNVLRTVAALSGRKEGGEMYEDEIDDETRKQLEALGYIIEDLD